MERGLAVDLPAEPASAQPRLKMNVSRFPYARCSPGRFATDQGGCSAKRKNHELNSDGAFAG